MVPYNQVFGGHTWVTRTHLGTLETRNDGVEEMRTLDDISHTAKEEIRLKDVPPCIQSWAASPWQRQTASADQGLELISVCSRFTKDARITSELSIYSKVLLVQDLKNGVEQATQRGIVRLFDNLGPCSLRVMLRYEGSKFIDVHNIFSALLVGAAENNT